MVDSAHQARRASSSLRVGASATAVTASGVNVTTAAFARGGDLAGTTLSNGAGFPTAKSIFVTGAQVDATGTRDWLGFTLAATSGNTLKLAELSFYYAYTNTSGTATGAATFEVRSSADNYTSAIGSFSQAVVNSTTPAWQQASVGLTALQYQNLDTITFRIYLDDGANSSGNTQLRLDTVALTGVSDASVVPEPSSAAALAGLAGLGLVALRRRRAA